MTPHRCATSISLVALAVGSGAADGPALAADDAIPLDVAEVSFELNDTDGDLGIYALIDGERWRVLRISDPKRRRLLDIQDDHPSHAAPPDNVQLSGTDAAADCDADSLPEVEAPIEIAWDAVEFSHPELGRTGVPINVVRYQVVVAREDPPFELSVELDPDTTSFTVPAGLLESGDEEIKLEILVREESGNLTAIETCFDVE